MEADIHLAYAVANALIKDRTLAELVRLQTELQTISCLVNAEIACLRANGASTTSQTNGGTS